MMKKILGAVAAAALITTVFAGCSTGEVGGTTSSKADGYSETKLTGTLTLSLIHISMAQGENDTTDSSAETGHRL